MHVSFSIQRILREGGLYYEMENYAYSCFFSLLLMACSTNEKETSNPKEPEQEAPVEEPVEETEPIIAPLTG